MALETNRFKKRQQSKLIDLVSARKRGSARPGAASDRKPAFRPVADRPLFATPVVSREPVPPPPIQTSTPVQAAPNPLPTPVMQPSLAANDPAQPTAGKLQLVFNHAKNLIIIIMARLPLQLPNMPGSKRTKTIVAASVALLIVVGGSVAAFGGSTKPKSVSDGATVIPTSNGNAVIAPASSNGSPSLSAASVPLAPAKSATATPSTTAATSAKTAPAPKLTFTPVVPTGKPSLAKNGTADGTLDSYTFDDLFEGTPVQVSEQPLPNGYPTVAKAISTIAGKIKANTVIPTTSNGTAYMASKFQNVNQQVVVFSDKYLLIFVQSKAEHEAANWPAYLNTFQ